MHKISDGIKALGFRELFLHNVENVDLDRFDLARVVAVHKDSYILNNGADDVLAEPIGKMLFSASSPVDLPAVGDWVFAAFYDKDAFAVIHSVLPRKSLLKRKTPGKKIDFQLIAANIDVALIVQSLDANFNLRRLERYLVMANDSNIEPIVLLSKSDLLEAADIENRATDIQDLMPYLHIQPFGTMSLQ